MRARAGFYEFQGPSYKRGRSEGQLQAAAADVLEVLEVRGLDVPAFVRARVQTCTDLAQLEHWLRRAVVVGSAEELFDY